MNKTELINKIAESAGISKADAKKALEATVDTIKQALIAGDKIQLIGFGTFAVSERPAREGINPATKEKIQIPAKKVAKFKAGAELADALKHASAFGKIKKRPYTHGVAFFIYLLPFSAQ